MTYNLGEKVILKRLMGEDLDPPVRCMITGTQLAKRGRLFEYEVEINAKSIETGRQVNNLKCWVKADWLAPAHIVIHEMPETPWD